MVFKERDRFPVIDGERRRCGQSSLSKSFITRQILGDILLDSQDPLVQGLIPFSYPLKGASATFLGFILVFPSPSL